MNPRFNRLKADYEKIRELAERSQFIDILSTEGQPPEKYVLLLKFRSITGVNQDGQPVFSTQHQLGIHLHQEYPRRKPTFMMLTNVFHPNIAGNGDICIGDDGDHGFAPNMGLDELVIRIIQMIRFENIGFERPYNTLAANWAKQHQSIFPLDTSQIITEEEPYIKIENQDINIIIGDDSVDDLGIVIS